MKTTSDIAALTETCLACPEEDTPRLMLADALDEIGEHDRSAFIRLQIEIASWGSPGPDEVEKAGRILQRYRKGAPVRLTANTPATKLARETILLEKHPEWRPKCFNWAGIFRRGLLHSVPVPSLNSVMVPRLAIVPEVLATLAPEIAWQLTDHARELLREFPTVREVVPANMHPEKWHASYAWYRETQPWTPRPQIELHCVIFDALNAGELHDSGQVRDYATRELATSALGNAVYRVLKTLLEGGAT